MAVATKNWTHLMDLAVQAPMATNVRPVPENDYRMQIEELEFDSMTPGKGPNKGKELPKLYVIFNVLDEGLKATLGRDKVQVRKQIILDLDQYGQLDFGSDKNTSLGQLREALGQNTAQEWTMRQLMGTGPILGKVVHRPNEVDPERPFVEVGRVSKLPG